MQRLVMRRSYVDTPGGQIHLRTMGHGPETVLMLHQTAASGAMYEQFAAAFLADPAHAERYSLMAPDTPGFGMSYRPADAYALASWAESMFHLLDACRIDRAHVLGHHTGGAIGIMMASARPERVLSLALIGGLALSDDERAAWHSRVRGMVLAADGTHLAAAWTQVGSIDGVPLAHPPSIELQHREVVDKLGAGVRWHEAYLAVFATNLGAELARTRMPALLICGTADVLHPYVPATLAARQGIQYVEVDAGAYVLDQHPAAVVEPYARFLSRAHMLEESI
jgi:pimeloyl-ACP methyl ester carboxylesterase